MAGAYGKPDPYTALKLGYGYMYYDDRFVRSLELPAREYLKEPCMVLMEELSDWRWGERWLYDIRGCLETLTQDDTMKTIARFRAYCGFLSTAAVACLMWAMLIPGEGRGAF